MSDPQIHVIGSADFQNFVRKLLNGTTRFHPPFYLIDRNAAAPSEVLVIEEYCGEMHQAEEKYLKSLAKVMKYRLEKVNKGGFTIFLLSQKYDFIRGVLAALN